MGWVKKKKLKKERRSHSCKAPQWGETRKLAPGSIWRCGVCAAYYTLVDGDGVSTEGFPTPEWRTSTIEEMEDATGIPYPHPHTSNPKPQLP